VKLLKTKSHPEPQSLWLSIQTPFLIIVPLALSITLIYIAVTSLCERRKKEVIPTDEKKKRRVLGGKISLLASKLDTVTEE